MSGQGNQCDHIYHLLHPDYVVVLSEPYSVLHPPLVAVAVAEKRRMQVCYN